MAEALVATIKRLANTDPDTLFRDFGQKVAFSFESGTVEDTRPVMRRLEWPVEQVKRSKPSVFDSPDADKENLKDQRAFVQQVQKSFGQKLGLICGPSIPLKVVNPESSRPRIPKPPIRRNPEMDQPLLAARRPNRGLSKWEARELSIYHEPSRRTREKLSRSLDQRDQSATGGDSFIAFMRDTKQQSLLAGIIGRPQPHKPAVVLQPEPLFSSNKYADDAPLCKLKAYLGTHRSKLPDPTKISRDDPGIAYALYEDYPLTATTQNPASSNRRDQVASNREEGLPDESRRILGLASMADSTSRSLLSQAIRPVARRNASRDQVISRLHYSLQRADDHQPSVDLSTQIYMADLKRRLLSKGPVPHDRNELSSGQQAAGENQAKSTRRFAKIPKDLLIKMQAFTHRARNN